jgi:hypothetical protein
MLKLGYRDPAHDGDISKLFHSVNPGGSVFLNGGGVNTTAMVIAATTLTATVITALLSKPV